MRTCTYTYTRPVLRGSSGGQRQRAGREPRGRMAHLTGLGEEVFGHLLGWDGGKGEPGKDAGVRAGYAL